MTPALKDPRLIGPRQKPRNFPEWMAYVVTWGLLAPVLLGAVVEAIGKIIIGNFTGATDISSMTSGLLWTVGMGSYYGVQVAFTWRIWISSLRIDAQNTHQKGQANAASGVATAVRGKGNVVHVNVTPPTKAGQLQSLEASILLTSVTSVRWETPTFNPTLAFNFEAINDGDVPTALHEVEVYWSASNHAPKKLRGRVVRAASAHLDGVLLPSGDRATFEAHIQVQTNEGPPPGGKAYLVVHPVKGQPTKPIQFPWP